MTSLINTFLLLPVFCVAAVFILEYALEVYEEMGRMSNNHGGKYNGDI